jgi:protein-disulfide isomerase
MTATEEDVKLVMPVGERDHAQGPDTAPVTLVEYGDYECPYCGQAYPIIKNIQKHLGDELHFVFRNFPITQVHPHAQHAAEAAEAAGAQSKFWEMHDYLYEHQRELDDSHLSQYAARIGGGIDVTRFDDEMAKHVYAGRVREDFMSGIRSGVNGTPTFYINGERYDDSWDEETLLETIKQAIEDRQQKQQHAVAKEDKERGRKSKKQPSRRTHYQK